MKRFSKQEKDAYDNSTYIGRLKNLFMSSNIKYILLSDKEVLQYKQYLDKYDPTDPKYSQVSNEELWKKYYAV